MIAPQNKDSPSPASPKGEFLATGERIGRYEIIRIIGRGGMGAVYEATDTQLHRRVAFKTLVGHLAGRPEAIRRFFLEAQAAGRLMHPNVVAIFDFNAEGDIPFMAMEFLQGEPLSSAIRKGPMPTKRVADALLGVCAGIESAHKAGIIHRDLKPSNIFLTVDWNGLPRPRVLDFGISKIRDISSGGLTQTGDILGTSQYLSPEHAAANRQVDARSDIYSLGVVMYEAVTQRTPHQGEPVYQVLRNVTEGRWQPPHAFCPDLPLAFEAVILRAMQLLPENRFPSAFEMGRALFPFASSRVKRQFDEYYNGTGGLSLPGPEAMIAAVGPAKGSDVRALPTEILPKSDIPDWQQMPTHTALPVMAPDLPRDSQEFQFDADSDAISPSAWMPPTRRWRGWVLVGGVVMGIGLIMLWQDNEIPSADRFNAPVERAPILDPSMAFPGPPAMGLPAASPPIETPPLPESVMSPAPPVIRPGMATQRGFPSRKRGKSPPKTEAVPALPLAQSSTIPSRSQRAAPNETSLAPTSKEGSSEPSKPSPDRW